MCSSGFPEWFAVALRRSAFGVTRVHAPALIGIVGGKLNPQVLLQPTERLEPAIITITRTSLALWRPLPRSPHRPGGGSDRLPSAPGPRAILSLSGPLADHDFACEGVLAALAASPRHPEASGPFADMSRAHASAPRGLGRRASGRSPRGRSASAPHRGRRPANGGARSQLAGAHGLMRHTRQMAP
jgi:hypothetical protein